MGVSASKKIKVVFFNRKPRKYGNFSVEIIFKLIEENLSSEFEIINKQMPYESSGIFKRFWNTIYCLFNQGDVNHITGDIHYVASFLKKSKTLVTVLDCGMLHQKTGFSRSILKLFWFDIPIRKAQLLTVISKATGDDLIKFTACKKEKIRLIYVCISPEFKRIEKNFDKVSPRILHIGTAENKNLKRIIPALKDINCTLVIVGKISDDIKQLIVDNNIKLELFDRRLSDEEVRQEYYKCDILSLVSTLEGFGMPIVEANVVGRIAITGNVTSMPEVAANAAHIVNPFDIKDIHEGFNKIIADDEYRNKLIENGYENANRFSVKTIAGQYADVYKELYNS